MVWCGDEAPLLRYIESDASRESFTGVHFSVREVNRNVVKDRSLGLLVSLGIFKGLIHDLTEDLLSSHTLSPAVFEDLLTLLLQHKHSKKCTDPGSVALTA